MFVAERTLWGFDGPLIVVATRSAERESTGLTASRDVSITNVRFASQNS